MSPPWLLAAYSSPRALAVLVVMVCSFAGQSAEAQSSQPLSQVSQPGEADANFGRWSSPVVPRDQREIPHTFLVSARKN